MGGRSHIVYGILRHSRLSRLTSGNGCRQSSSLLHCLNVCRELIIYFIFGLTVRTREVRKGVWNLMLEARPVDIS